MEEKGGEEIQRMAGRTLHSSTRSTDFIGRRKDDEFVAVMVNVDAQRLGQIADRFRVLLERASLGSGGTALTVTASIGAIVANPEDTPETILERIRALVSRSRREGGNRVLVG
jgi:diguanylate cyclase (GGDEF)-like protein